MKLMLVGDWSRTTFEEIGSKFGRGEDLEPEGAQIVARWHDPSSRMVWIVVEFRYDVSPAPSGTSHALEF